jgi:hypothetical protein
VVTSSVGMSRWRIEHFFTVMQAEKVYYHSDLVVCGFTEQVHLGVLHLVNPMVCWDIHLLLPPV